MSEVILPGDPEELFELDVVVGHGHFGKVYKAKRKEDGETVAIKILPWADDDEANDKMREEIHLMMGCDTPYVVRFFGSYLKGSDLWIVMEFCAAGSFAGVIARTEDGMEEKHIALIMRDMLSGLSYLHGKRMLHRDIKADNVLLGSDGYCKLADLGVAAQLTNTMDNRSTATGTPYWMAPELILEQGYSSKVDIWSLGITAIECAERKPPLFDMVPMRALFIIATGDHPPPSLKNRDRWSDHFHDFIARCLVKDPQNRAGANELLDHPFVKTAPSRDEMVKLSDSLIQFREQKRKEKELKKRAMQERRLSLGRNMVNKISNLSALKDNAAKNQPASFFFLDDRCAFTKEKDPWASDPLVRKKAFQGKVVGKIDNEKMKKLYHKLRDPISGIPHKNHTYRFRSYKDCFVASEGIAWFKENLRLDTVEEALVIAETLTQRGLIEHVSHHEPFQNNTHFHRVPALDGAQLEEQILEDNLSQLVMLARWGIVSDNKWRGKFYENSFKGDKLLGFLKAKLEVSDKEAMNTANILFDRCFMYRVDSKENFSGKALYRFFENDSRFFVVPTDVKAVAFEKANRALE